MLCERNSADMRMIPLLILFSLAGSFAFTEAEEKDLQIVFFKDYKSVPDGELPFWIAYSMILGKCINEQTADYETYPIVCEVQAREAILKLLKNDSHPRYYFDLAKVSRQGYMREYVFYHHRQEQWTILDIEKHAKFQKWRKEELASHKPKTHLIGMMNNHITNKGR